MLDRLSNDERIESITVVCVGKKFEEKRISKKLILKCVDSNGGVFSYCPHLASKLFKVLRSCDPDVIDIQGGEFFIGTSLIELDLDVPVVLTLQGFSSEINKYLWDGLGIGDLIFRRTMRDYVCRDGIVERRYSYRRRGENERRLIKTIKYFIGRTSWDHGLVLNMNPSARYFHCGRILRDQFYGERWDLKEVNRYSIHITSANYSLKGLHIALDALHIVKRQVPGVLLTVSGKDLVGSNTLLDYVATTGYQKVIRAKLQKLSLHDNVRFVGELAAPDLVKRLKSSHLFLLPSLNENSPNALGEAQILGMPCIASFVGGVPDYITDRASGLLYNPTDSARLASLIIEVFSDDSLAHELGTNARVQAVRRHDPDDSVNDLVSAYSVVCNDAP